MAATEGYELPASATRHPRGRHAPASRRAAAGDARATTRRAVAGDRTPAGSHGGLLALGAVGGTAAGAAVGAIAGASDAVLSFAALVGFDVGLLLGAAVGSYLERRPARPARQRPVDRPAVRRPGG